MQCSIAVSKTRDFILFIWLARIVCVVVCTYKLCNDHIYRRRCTYVYIICFGVTITVEYFVFAISCISYHQTKLFCDIDANDVLSEVKPVVYCFNMIAIGHYFVLILSVTGTILTDDTFSETNKEQFLNDIFNIHNKYRTIHGVPILKRAENLNEFARFLLKSLKAKDISVGSNATHRNLAFLETKATPDTNTEEKLKINGFTNFHNEYGVIFQLRSLKNDSVLNTSEAHQLLLKWTNMNGKYNYSKEPSIGNADEFTQILWKNTTHLGLAITALNTSRAYAVIAVYFPPGNIEKQFVNNVFPKSFYMEGSSSNI